MTPNDLKAVANAARELTLSGPGLAEIIEGTAHYELWHSRPDQGLAVHFLAEPSAESQPLPPLNRAGELVLKAADFMDRAGIDRAADLTDLTVRAVDEGRRVVSIKLGRAAAQKPAAGVLDDYEAL